MNSKKRSQFGVKWFVWFAVARTGEGVGGVVLSKVSVSGGIAGGVAGGIAGGIAGGESFAV